MADSAISVKNLFKSYRAGSGKTVKAVGGISFEVGKGEIFGLIGPDGSGKTSTIRMLSTLILPDAGEIVVCGLDAVKDYARLRLRTGYMPERFSLYQDLSVEENLDFFATLFEIDVEKNYSLIAEIYDQLKPFKTRQAGKLSGGMKQKLALCCALIHKPEVLILDEPTTGVDPISRKEFWDLLGKLKDSGITVLTSTPYMNEAERCDKIAFMLDGRILKMDKPSAIAGSFPKKIIHARTGDMFSLLENLRASEDVEYAYAFGDTNHAVLKNARCDLAALGKTLEDAMRAPVSIEAADAQLEDCFMELSRTHEGH